MEERPENETDRLWTEYSRVFDDWDETTLAGLFQILATLRETPDPVAVLASLLTDPGPLDAGSVAGMAHPADGAAPAGAVVAVAR